MNKADQDLCDPDQQTDQLEMGLTKEKFLFPYTPIHLNSIERSNNPH